MTVSSIRRQFLRLTGAAVLGLLLLPLGPTGQARAADAAGLVGALTSQLGITPAQAEGGTGALFGLARQRMAPEQYGEVERSVPGVGDLVARHGGQGHGPQPHGAGGGLGGMASDALGGAGGGVGGGAMGGGLGALAPIAGQLSGLGISPQTAGNFLPVVMQYLSGNGAGNAAGLLKGALGG